MARTEAVPVPNPSCLVERNWPFSSIGAWQQVLSTASVICPLSSRARIRIFFDNRGPGHDGTITSDKKQICEETEIKEGYPYFGFADKNGKVLRTIPMPFYCNHYHTNNDNTFFTGDGVEDIMLIRINGQEAEMKPLAKHNTTWKYHRSHCHPTFSWDGRKILYTADRDDANCDLYLVDAEF